MLLVLVLTLGQNTCINLSQNLQAPTMDYLQVILQEVVSFRLVAHVVFATVFLVRVSDGLYIGCRGIVFHHSSRQGPLGGLVGWTEQVAETEINKRKLSKQCGCNKQTRTNNWISEGALCKLHEIIHTA